MVKKLIRNHDCLLPSPMPAGCSRTKLGCFPNLYVGIGYDRKIPKDLKPPLLVLAYEMFVNSCDSAKHIFEDESVEISSYRKLHMFCELTLLLETFLLAL